MVVWLVSRWGAYDATEPFTASSSTSSLNCMTTFAVIFDDKRITYGQLEEKTRHLANGLYARGILSFTDFMPAFHA